MAGTATVDILAEGYLSGGGEHVGSTVGLVRDGDAIVVIDPGLVASRAAILDPLDRLGLAPGEVTDVVLSHHHPDHTLNAALFPAARVHDLWAIYQDDVWISRPAEGYELSPNVRLIQTPGHSPEDISTLVDTADGLVVFTHLWWTAAGPAEDPYAPEPALLHSNRIRVISLRPHRIVPGHGPPFEVTEQTPR